MIIMNRYIVIGCSLIGSFCFGFVSVLNYIYGNLESACLFNVLMIIQLVLGINQILWLKRKNL